MQFNLTFSRLLNADSATPNFVYHLINILEATTECNGKTIVLHILYNQLNEIIFELFISKVLFDVFICLLYFCNLLVH